MAIDMHPTFSKRLVVIDVSPILWTYTCTAGYAKSSGAITVKGVKVPGIKALLEICAKNYANNYRTVLCMDSYSELRRKNSNYKANRTFNPVIAAQNDIVERYFKDFGVDVLKCPGWEADHLIYSVVYSNINKFREIEVITCDKDIYGVIIAPNVQIIGANSQSPTVNVANYSNVISGEIEIPYNMILPYNTLYGKPSNTLRKLRLNGQNEKYFNQIYEMVKDDPSKGSDLDVLVDFLSTDTVPAEHIEKIAEQAQYTYPRTKDIQIEPEGPKPIYENLLSFCAFYKQYTSADIYGFTRHLSSAPIPRELATFIKNLFITIKNGTKSVDNGLKPDTAPQEIYKTGNTSEFLEVEEW